MKKMICFFVVLFFVKCSLDEPITNKMTGFSTIDNVYVADETLAGIYLSIPKNRILFSKLSDDFYPNKNLKFYLDELRMYQWYFQTILAKIRLLFPWIEYYKTISKANMLLKALPNVFTKSPPEKQKLNNIHAQTLCLKALCYFELVRIYAPIYEDSKKNESGIVLKNKVIAEELPRATLEETYKEIVRLLKKSLPLFSGELKTNARFSVFSAKALLAKVYLFWRKYDKAIAFAEEVLKEKFISKDPNTAKKNYEKIWKNPNEVTVSKKDKNDRNNEVLLAFEYGEFVFSEIYNDINPADNYEINPKIKYEKQDYRKNIIALSGLENKKYIGKYRTKLNTTPHTNIAYLRTAELYFIKAQGHIGLGQESEAENILKNFLKLRFVLNKNNISLHPILQSLLKEKQKEFVGEGQRYFDLKFYKKELKYELIRRTIYGIQMEKVPFDDYRWVFPIPEMELRTNRNMRQNKGWQDYEKY